jgi:four helix bundle protein
MSTFHRFEDIEAWRLARTLANRIYDVTTGTIFSRDFGLRDQIRRASISIVSNIAEGFERDGDREFVQFLFIAKGSGGEVRAQLYLAHDRSYLSDDQFQEIHAKAVELSRILAGLIRYLQQSKIAGRKYKVATQGQGS